jgi:beta-lactam-binding protein with PASTA domain/predicted Ser/Thr protein kinase
MNFHVAAGTVIDGRYRVVSRVGSGGMADVYCAEDTQLGRRVAVKLLHERFAQDEEFVERFRREASSAASLSHANIVNVYDRGEWGDTYYIAMEYLDGRSLDSIVREEAPLAPERAIEITEQVLRASRFAHSRGVVHRDLKPHNVIIDGEGRVKVTDFGIARAGASEITQTGSIMGTARYLSPEQAQGHTVSPRSDLYAVGIMLYELLTGTVPFEGDSVVAIALRHLSEPPRPPSSLVPTISPNLDAIVMRALAKDPERRFADADEFLAALEGEREHERRDGGSHTAALAPVVVAPTAYPHPATYTTQAIGPLGPMSGAYGTAPPYWDPNTTGIIPPGAIMLPPGGRRGPVWPWALLGVFVAAAAIAALVFVLVNNHVSTVTVPHVVGQSKVDAEATLQADGFVPIPITVNSVRPAGTVVRQTPRGGQQAKSGANVVLRISGGRALPSSRQVPNVLGLSGTSATHQLHVQGFTVSPARAASTTVPKNEVISTVPAGGSTAPRGSIVVMTLSSGPPSVAVPNVVGETLDQARLLLQQRLFAVATTKQSSTQPPGTVLKQAPASAKAPQGSTVTLTVAEAPPNVTVPYLIGLTEADAGARLGKLGLTPSPITLVREKNPAYDNLVLSQLPHAGASVQPGSVVIIRIEHYVPPAGSTSTTTSTTTTSTTTTSTTTTGPSGASGATGVG